MSKMVIIEGNSSDKDNVRAIMVKGEQGYSAYDLYVQNGGTLTEEQWLDAFLNAENFYNKTEIDEKFNIPLTLDNFSTELKSSVIPHITDFGSLSISTFNSIMEQDIPFLRLSGSLTTDTPIIINRPITLICDNFTITQTVWGYPAIIVLSDNVKILGDIDLICDVNNRTPVENPYYSGDTSDPKSNSTGIMLGHGTTHSNFYAENISVENFISGICNLSLGFSNINIDYLYVENVDFGVFGARYFSTHIGCVEFKNIASYVGSTDPSHAIYLTGGETVGLSEDFTVNYIKGDGCKSKSTDTVIGLKSTLNFKCNGGYVSNISGLIYVIKTTGYIENIIVEDATSGISTQLSNTDFIFKNLKFKKIDVIGQYINYFTNSSKAKVIDCEFNVNSDDYEYAYVYVSGTDTEYYEQNCNYISPNNSLATLYNRTSSYVKFYVFEPKASINLFMGDYNNPNAYMLLNPKNLNYPKTNCLVPNPHFTENDLVVDEQDSPNYPYAFRTNDKVRVSDANINYFNTNNVTNGIIYTLFNGGNVRITNGPRVKTKTGEDYTTDQWTIFRFMLIGNVAYEI